METEATRVTRSAQKTGVKPPLTHSAQKTCMEHQDEQSVGSSGKSSSAKRRSQSTGTPKHLRVQSQLVDATESPPRKVTRRSPRLMNSSADTSRQTSPASLNTQSKEDLSEASSEQSSNASTRSSRRTASPDGSTHSDEPVQKRLNGARKSKRRSSFVRGRICKSPMQLSSKDLLQDIPVDLPAQERFMQLNKTALKFTLQKLSEEFPDLEGLQQFQIEALEVGDKKIQELEAEGAFLRATQKERYLPNPANVELNDAIEKIHKMSQRLEKEKAEWEDLLKARTQLAEEAKRVAYEAEGNPVTAPSGGLSAAQQSLLNGQLDLNKIRSNISHTQDQVTLLAYKLKIGVDVLQKFFTYVEAVIGQQAHLFREKAFEGLEDFHDPRHLIQKFLNTSTSHG